MDYNSIAQIVGVLPDYLTLPLLYIIRYYFYKKFLGFKKKIWTYIFATLLLVIFEILTNNLIPNILVMILSDILLLFTMHLICQGNLIIKLYAIVVENTILLLVNLIFLPFEFWVNPIINNLDMSFKQRMLINFTHNTIFDILNYIILYMLLKRVTYYLNLKDKFLNLSQSIYLLLPCLSGYGLALIFYLIQEVKIDNKIYYLPNIASKVYYIILPFICFLFLISIPISACTFKNMIESEEHKHKNIIIKQQFALQLNHIKNIDGIYLGIRKVIHDMNNHISCLKNLADNNNLDEIKNYLHNISKTVSKLDLEIKTGNPISDAIINEKFNISQTEGIKFISDFILPPKTFLESIDLCVILSNALDNSIEACRKITNSDIEKKISIKSYIRGLYLIIEISNSSMEKLRYIDNKIISSKSDIENHGIGLSNIEDVVKKYNGVLDVIEEKNYITLSIMIKVN